MHPLEIVDRYFRVNVFSLGGVLSSVAYKCRLHIPYIGSSVVDPLWVCKTFSDYEKYPGPLFRSNFRDMAGGGGLIPTNSQNQYFYPLLGNMFVRIHW